MTDRIEGLATCDACGQDDHTDAQLKTCLDSLLDMDFVVQPVPRTRTTEDDGTLCGPGYVNVWVCWGGVDREVTMGWLVRQSIAPRLIRAIEVGAVMVNARIATDIHGQTYVAARSLVSGKHPNADLKRLGF